MIYILIVNSSDTMSLSKREIFFHNIAQTSTYPLAMEVESANGVYIIDKSGKKYFDLNSGISVSSLGHRHPKVIGAIKTQLDKYMHTMVYGEHIQSPQTDYAKLLMTQLNPKLDCIYYLNSGTEVIEAAMKLAKRATGRYEIISCRNAYHGSSQGSESLRSDHEFSRSFLPLLPGIKHIEFNNFDDLNRITGKTAAIILEPIQAEAGVILPKAKYLKEVQKRCAEVGCLLILDEIQTGFGRTGQLFAYQKYEILPDLLCLGKAMGGGLPVGALVGNRGLINMFSNNPDLGHISTFAGHPVICASAKATLEVLIEENLIEQVNTKSEYITSRLQEHGIVAEVRAAGLMMAVELTKRKYLKHVVQEAFSQGALIDYFLFNNKCFRLAPPLIYTMEELQSAIDIICSALDYAKNKYE